MLMDPSKMDTCIDENACIDQRSRVTDVSEEMKVYVDELALTFLTLPPAKIWEKAKAKMDLQMVDGQGFKRHRSRDEYQKFAIK